MALKPAGIFEDGEQLRREAERRYGRKLSEDEWMSVDPEKQFAGPVPFDSADLEQLVEGIVAVFPKTNLTGDARVRREMRRVSEAIALRAQSFVEKQRRRLFGQPTPPCRNSVEVEKWLDERKFVGQAPYSTIRVTAVVSNQGGMDESLAGVGRLILEATSASIDGRPSYRDYLDRTRAEHLRLVGGSMPAVVYFRHDREGKPLEGTYGWPAPPGTPLGNLYDEVEELSKKTGWRNYVCVHHLLTGELMSSPERVETRNPIGTDWFGVPSITLTIYEPANVTGDYVKKAYLEARERQSSEWQTDGASRKRASSAAGQSLVPFVDNLRPQKSWPEVFDEWNDSRPGQQYPSIEALRSAYRRAEKRL